MAGGQGIRPCNGIPLKTSMTPNMHCHRFPPASQHTSILNDPRTYFRSRQTQCRRVSGKSSRSNPHRNRLAAPEEDSGAEERAAAVGSAEDSGAGEKVAAEVMAAVGSAAEERVVAGSAVAERAAAVGMEEVTATAGAPEATVEEALEAGGSAGTNADRSYHRSSMYRNRRTGFDPPPCL